MPELPEVETVARQLRPLIKGKVISEVQILDSKLNSKALKSIKGLKIKDVYRAGKEIIFEFDNNHFLSIHLRMTGRLIALNAKKVRALTDFYYKTSINKKHVRFKLKFGNNELHFVDPRRFGTVKLLNSLPSTGIDPISNNFTRKVFSNLLEKASQPSKNWLMRQDRIVGIGNIYASEILFAAKIKPTRKINTLAPSEVKLLFVCIKKILNNAIKYCGTTFSDFQTTTGEVGSFQNLLKVYGRENQCCYICKSKIKRIVQQQRSTFYCPKCQH